MNVASAYGALGLITYIYTYSFTGLIALTPPTIGLDATQQAEQRHWRDVSLGPDAMLPAYNSFDKRKTLQIS